MLPVVSGESTTRTQILVYSVLLVPIGLAPYIMGFGGLTYGIVAAVLGAIFLGLAVQIRAFRDQRKIRRAAMRLFAFSIFYLTALFATLLIERLAHLV
jgi:protoheme IX farnesyltransferase